MKLPWTTFHLSKIEYPTSKHQKSIWNLLHKEKKPLGSICQPPQTKHKKPTNLKTLKHCVIFQPEKNPRFFSPAWAIFLSPTVNSSCFCFSSLTSTSNIHIFSPWGEKPEKVSSKAKKTNSGIGTERVETKQSFPFQRDINEKVFELFGKNKVLFILFFYQCALVDFLSGWILRL